MTNSPTLSSRPPSVQAGFTSQQPAPAPSAAAQRAGSTPAKEMEAGPSRTSRGSSQTPQAPRSVEEQLYDGPSLFGPGWREVESFQDLSDEEDYSSDEEETYAILDLGPELDHRALAKEGTFQLIGLETATPFLKLGNQVYHGRVNDPIGDEVILERVRNETTPAQPSYPPSYKATHHLAFRPVTLRSKNAGQSAGPGDAGWRNGSASAHPGDPEYLLAQDLVDASNMRSITMQAPAPFGPNRGRKELLGGIEARERAAGTGRFVGSGGAGSGSASAAASPAAQTPGPSSATLDGRGSTARPSRKPPAAAAASRGAGPGAVLGSREDTPLRSVADMLGPGDITPKVEPDDHGAGGYDPYQHARNAVADPSGSSGPPREHSASHTSTPAPYGGAPARAPSVQSTPYDRSSLSEAPRVLRFGHSTPEAGHVTPVRPAGPSMDTTSTPTESGFPVYVPKPLGRPKGSGRPKDRFTFDSEEALRERITLEDLVTNPIVELLLPADLNDPDAPIEYVKLTKKQVQNVLEGRPARGKGSRSGKVGSQLRTRPEKVAASEAGGDGSEMEVDDAGAGASRSGDQEGPAREEVGDDVDDRVPQRRRKPIPSAQAGMLTFTHVGKEHASADPERRRR